MADSEGETVDVLLYGLGAWVPFCWKSGFREIFFVGSLTRTKGLRRERMLI